MTERITQSAWALVYWSWSTSWLLVATTSAVGQLADRSVLWPQPASRPAARTSRGPRKRRGTALQLGRFGDGAIAAAADHWPGHRPGSEEGDVTIGERVHASPWWSVA